MSCYSCIQEYEQVLRKKPKAKKFLVEFGFEEFDSTGGVV
jgi:hypothetical protein